MAEFRKTELLKALQWVGIDKIPDDSTACADWIQTEGETTGIRSLNDVVNEMIEMDFLYNRTLYLRILRQAGMKKADYEDNPQDFYRALRPLKAVAAANWLTYKNFPLYMLPTERLRDEVRAGAFEGWRCLLI